jgi:hypothetical protein
MVPGPLKMGWDAYVARNDNSFATLDDVNTYNINENGCRGRSFSNEPLDVLAAGCSITFGIGVPEDGIWTEILSQLSNRTVANIGMPGHSVTAICKNVIKYCMNYGNPKTIYCLFPDFFRMLFVQDPDYLTTNREENRNLEVRLVTANIADNVVYRYEDNKDQLLFKRIDKNKNSITLEDSVSPHQAILESINAIYMLESFCKTNNIEFVWSTWSNITKILLESLLKLNNFELTQYVPIDDLKYSNYNCNELVKNCTTEHNTKLSEQESWKVGSDYFVNNKKRMDSFYSHPGTHFQYHIAEFFNNVVA